MKNTIERDENGNECVRLYPHGGGREAVLVQRLSRGAQNQCSHEWAMTAYEGRSKWRSGCLKCGALSR